MLPMKPRIVCKLYTSIQISIAPNQSWLWCNTSNQRWLWCNILLCPSRVFDDKDDSGNLNKNSVYACPPAPASIISHSFSNDVIYIYFTYWVTEYNWYHIIRSGQEKPRTHYYIIYWSKLLKCLYQT